MMLDVKFAVIGQGPFRGAVVVRGTSLDGVTASKRLEGDTVHASETAAIDSVQQRVDYLTNAIREMLRGALGTA